MEQEHVILLHGLCRTSRSMRRMADAVSAAGFRVNNVDYPSRLHSVEQLSRQFVGAALSKAEEAGAPRVHFVTHSLGGILVREFVRQSPGAKIGRVVMLGPPNQGSEVVDRLRSWIVFQKLNGPAGSQLGTDPLSVPNNLGRVSFPVGIIAGRRSINLINSCWIEGPDDGKVSVERTKVEGMSEHIVLPVSHPFLMRNAAAIRLTIEFLRHGSFGALQSTVLRPNQTLEPTSTSVTNPADAGLAPAVAVAHLKR